MIMQVMPYARRSSRWRRRASSAPLATRDLDVAEMTDGSGAVRVVLALPCWDDYLRTSLDDLIESAAGSPMVLLRARTLLTSLLNAAPAQRQPSIAWRLQHTEDLTAGSFPLIWRHAAGKTQHELRPETCHRQSPAT
jgi:hypothetical protein